jgi:hypothetical protein
MPVYLLWALMSLKQYNTEEMNAPMFHSLVYEYTEMQVTQTFFFKNMYVSQAACWDPDLIIFPNVDIFCISISFL